MNWGLQELQFLPYSEQEISILKTISRIRSDAQVVGGKLLCEWDSSKTVMLQSTLRRLHAWSERWASCSWDSLSEYWTNSRGENAYLMAPFRQLLLCVDLTRFPRLSCLRTTQLLVRNSQDYPWHCWWRMCFDATWTASSPIGECPSPNCSVCAVMMKLLMDLNAYPPEFQLRERRFPSSNCSCPLLFSIWSISYLRRFSFLDVFQQGVRCADCICLLRTGDWDYNVVSCCRVPCERSFYELSAFSDADEVRLFES